MADQHSNNEEEVLQLLAAGNEAAFTQLFDRYRNKVYGVAFRFLKSSILAEEIVQDVFMKIWLKRGEVTSIERFDAYLFVMARNMIFDKIKKLAREALVHKELARNLSDTDYHTENQLKDRQYQLLLQEAVNLLPSQQKQVYQLSKGEGLSHEAIAERMQLSKLTVKAHMAKALQSIRAYLNRHLHSSVLINLLLNAVMMLRK
ncbi:MAG: RNA polymerase sigma-70 factor [Williamsia sp.]|nr:RNA polymerase sigma-70 factor [Williamsia sp.]